MKQSKQDELMDLLLEQAIDKLKSGSPLTAAEVNAYRALAATKAVNAPADTGDVENKMTELRKRVQEHPSGLRLSPAIPPVDTADSPLEDPASAAG